MDNNFKSSNYDELRYETNKNMDLYVEAKENQHRLNSENSMCVGAVESRWAKLPQGSVMKDVMDGRGEEYDKEKRSNTQSLTLVKSEHEERLPMAGFINVAILLYAMINIGIILAISFLK